MNNYSISPQLAARTVLARRQARRSLVEYARFIDVPGAPISDDESSDACHVVETKLASHHVLILQAAQRAIEQKSGRLMIFMPPGSAKSTYGSVIVPSYCMGKYEGHSVICVSYGSDMAKKFGRRTRSVIRQKKYKALFETELSGEQSAADQWALTNNSEYMSAGILSGITGNRADLIVIDDPIRSRQDADSEIVRQRTIDEYNESVMTRLKPGGSVIIIQTRWHEGDLSGQLLPEGYNGESGIIEGRDGSSWDVISLAAKCERADDPLGRRAGEYLWPEWFTQDHWAKFERHPRMWSALFQQRPAPETGDYFKKEWIRFIDENPPLQSLSVYGGSDYAVTANGGDFTVHAVIGIDPSDRMYLLDIWRAQASSDVWVDAFCDLVRKWKPIGWAEETGQIKSSMGPFLTKRMIQTESFVAREQFATRGDKSIRAQSIRGRMALSGLYVRRDAPWVSDLISEMMSFPVGVHDDQVDALGLVGQLINKMVKGNQMPEKRQMDYDAVYASPLPRMRR